MITDRQTHSPRALVVPLDPLLQNRGTLAEARGLGDAGERWGSLRLAVGGTETPEWGSKAAQAFLGGSGPHGALG